MSVGNFAGFGQMFRTMRYPTIRAWLAVCFFCCRLGATGDSIEIENPGFENLTGSGPAHFDGAGKLRDAHYSVYSTLPATPSEGPELASANPIPGWQTVAFAGTYNPPATLFPLGPPEGNNTAWINVTGVIRQTLTETFRANTTYQLTVGVGAIQGITFPGYEVGLFAAGDVVLSERSFFPVAPSGHFGSVSAEGLVPVGSPFVGLPIEVRLGIPGMRDGQINFDWVRLEASPVPEPGIIALGMISLVVTAACCRSKR
jgi:hypothetical protein